MLAKKRKITKREMKEDKLVTFYYESVDFVQRYQNYIIGAAVGIAAVVLLAYYFVNAAETKNEKAGLELSKVMNLYDAGLYNEAIEGRPGTDIIGLKKIVDEYGGSENGEVARMYLANSYYYTGDFSKAMDEYDDYSGDNKLFKSAAIAGVAACYSDKGQFEDAGDMYLKASKITETNPQNSEYLLNAGINYLRSGNKSDAKDALDLIKKDYKQSAEFSLADRYLAQCG